jgi:DNA-binding CsgD family transcriptional regulator
MPTILRYFAEGASRNEVSRKFGVNVLTLKRAVKRYAPDVDWATVRITPAQKMYPESKTKQEALQKRNEDIVRLVTIEGKTYKQAGDVYGLTREAVRLILMKARPKWKRPPRYSLCTRCGGKRTFADAHIRQRHRFDPNLTLCGVCREKLRTTKVLLVCSICCETKKLERGKLFHRYAKQKNFHINAKQTVATHVCNKCFYNRAETGVRRDTGWSWHDSHMARKVPQAP